MAHHSVLKDKPEEQKRLSSTTIVIEEIISFPEMLSSLRGTQVNNDRSTFSISSSGIPLGVAMTKTRG